MKKKQQRILSFLLMLVMLFSIFPVSAFAADMETPQTPQAEANEIPDETSMPTIEDAGIALTPLVPAETESSEPTEPETVPQESTVPSESTEPVTEPEETTIPSETTVPEESAPAQTEPVPPTETVPETLPEAEIDDLSIKVGDTVLLQESAADDRLLLAGQRAEVVRWEHLYNEDIYYNYYVYDSAGNPVKSWVNGYINEVAAFVLSNGSIAYCLQPHKAGPTGQIHGTSFQSWDSIKREGITRAMAYGAPNNGDRSKEGMLATALVIWDVACGYRRENGNRNFSGTTPFESVAASTGTTVKAAYDSIVYRMKIHGMIPSFTAKSESSIGAANTVILKRASNGNYVGSVRDTNGILPAYQFISPVSGLSITRSGGVLNITATSQAAQSLKNGVTIRSRRSDAPLRDTDLQIWKKDGTNSSGREYQEIVSMPGGIDPVPCFFRVKTEVQPSIATLQKTSDTSVQGYCFKLYRWENSRSWYGKTDANGNMYETDGNYNAKTGTYEWKGLSDGHYAIKEVLSVYGKDLAFPTSMTLTVTNPNGQVTFAKTYTGNEIVKDANGDAHPNDPKIHLTGLTYGGTLTIQIHNAGSAVPFTLKKSAGKLGDQLKGNACYSLAGAEYTVKKAGVVQEILVTDASGNAVSAKKYPIGTRLEIQETKAPKGFKIDNTTYPLTIHEGTNEIKVTDEPSLDPRSLIFEKKDPLTGQTAPQGNGSFEGAVFMWEYYDNHDWSGSPTRRWYFRTNEIGRHMYQKSFLAPGYQSDPLYVNEKGWNKIPLGSVKVTEIAAPTGYGQLPTLYATITQKSNGASAEFDWTPESDKIVQSKDGRYLFPEPIDKSTFGSLSIQKTDADTGGAAPSWVDFSGCEFTVYNNSANPVKVGDFPIANPGEACYVLTVNAAGQASTDKIFPIGNYTIKETKGNAHYQCNTEWSQSFTITDGGNAAVSFTAANAPVKGHIQLKKVDMENGESLSGAVFEVTFPDGSKHPMTELPNGVHELRDLRYGTYQVQEIQAPVGYVLDSTIYTVDIKENDKTYTITTPGHEGVPNQIIKGHFKLQKLEKGTSTPLQGAEYTIKDPTGKVVGVYTTDENGVIEVRDLKYGKGYSYQETKAPAGFIIDDTVYTFDVTEHDKTYYYERENTPQPGSIGVQKVDSFGNHMEGVTFLLEYSVDDGSTWNPVASRQPDDVLTVGTSSTQGIVDGKLTTDSNGKITFDGLRINSQTGNVRYRLTEVATTDGHNLMAGTAFDGQLSEDGEIDVVITAVNGTAFEMPSSGGHGEIIPTIGAIVMIGALLFYCLCVVNTQNKDKKFEGRKNNEK